MTPNYKQVQLQVFTAKKGKGIDDATCFGQREKKRVCVCDLVLKERKKTRA